MRHHFHALLVALSAVLAVSAVSHAQDQDVVPEEPRPLSKQSSTPNVPESDYGRFPKARDRELTLRALASESAPDCEGEPVAETARRITRLLGGRSSTTRAVVMNLIFTEDGVGQNNIESLIVSLASQEGAATYLAIVAKHADQIAKRLIRAAEAVGADVSVPEDKLIASIRTDILRSVIAGAALERSSAARALVSSLSADQSAAVREEASAMLSTW